MTAPNTQDDFSAGYIAQREVTDEDVDARQLAAAKRSDLAQADVATTGERMARLQPAPAAPEPAGAVAPPEPGTSDSGAPAQPTGGFAPGAGGGAGLPAIKAAADFVANLPRNVAIGGLKASENIESFIYDSAATVASSFTEEPIEGGTMKQMVDLFFDDISPEFAINTREVLKQAETDGPADLLTQNMAEFLLPFSAFAKLNASMGLTGTLGKKALNVITADAQTNIMALDPHMERFAGLLQEFEVAGEVPILGTFIDYLADTSEESAAEGRFKNALDSASVNATFAGALFGAGKLIKFSWNLPDAIRRMPASPPAGSRAAQRGAVGIDSRLLKKDGTAINDSEVNAILNTERFLDRGLKIRKGQKLYRGTTSGDGFLTNRKGGAGTFGRGLYTTTDKAQAKQFGDVVEMPIESLPKNPIRFENEMAFQNWTEHVRQTLGFKRQSEIENNFSGVDEWIRKLDPGIDGVQIGVGKGSFFVRFPE